MWYRLLNAVARVIWTIIILCIIAAVIWAVVKVRDPRTLPITSVTVQGVGQQNQQEVVSMIKPFLNHGFFQVNINGIRQSLEGLPWSAHVEVERKWPNQLLIAIYPQNIIATWNQKGVMNDMGETFAAGTLNYIDPTMLPKLEGPQGTQIQVLFDYQSMSVILAPIGLKIVQMTLHDNGDCEILLDNGIKVMLGTQDPLTRLQRFVKVYNKVFSANMPAQGNVVDLRYSNGMAVQWGSH